MVRVCLVHPHFRSRNRPFLTEYARNEEKAGKLHIKHFVGCSEYHQMRLALSLDQLRGTKLAIWWRIPDCPQIND